MPKEFRLGQQSLFRDLRWIRASLTQVALPPGSTANEWANIILIRSNATSSVFPVTAAGLTDALAAGSSGDMVWVPPATLADDFVVPAGIGVTSMGNKTILQGQVTLGNNSFLLSMIVLKTYNQAGTATGVIGPGSGTAYLDDTSVLITNTGAGDVEAVAVSAGGDVEVWACDVNGNASGAGDGYGIVQTSGDAFVFGGRVRGSTATFSGTVQEFSFVEEIQLVDSGGALKRLYPFTDTGLTASLTAAGTDDGVLLPPGSLSGGPWTVGTDITMRSLYRMRTELTGDITVDGGLIVNLRVIGNLTAQNGGQARDCFLHGNISLDDGRIFECSARSDSGVTVTISGDGGAVLLTNIQFTDGTTYGIFCNSLNANITANIRYNSIAPDDTGTNSGIGVYLDEAGINFTHNRVYGMDGGADIRNARIVSNSYFNTINGDGMVHSTGTVPIANCYFTTDDGAGKGVNLSGAGATLTNCGWKSINGIANATIGLGTVHGHNHSSGVVNDGGILTDDYHDGHIFMIGAGKHIEFSGTHGGGNEAITYEDSGGTTRLAFLFPGANVVAITNRAANGVVQIRANTGAAGGGGEMISAVFEDDNIQLNYKTYINETVNTKMTTGLTINQGAADDEIISLKSSDVAHGITDITETDTYCRIAKTGGAPGGVRIQGFRDADGPAGFALMLDGNLGEAADTTKSTAGIACMMLRVAVKSGTGLTTVGADGNLVIIQNYTTTRFIFDAEGTMHHITGDNDLDILALSATTGAPTISWDESEDVFSLTHGLIIAAGGLTLVGTARVLRSLDFEPDALKKGGVGPADSTEDSFPMHDYDSTNDESVFVHWEIPHDYASAGEIHLHVEFFVDTAPAGAESVTWGIEYKKQSIGDNFDFGAGTTTVITNTALTTGTPANDKKITDSGQMQLTTTGFEPMDIILIRIFRDADASEGGATDDFGSDARVFNYHLMYLSDKLGEAT